MTNDEKLISSLESTIETQKQLIKLLTAEIDRLNLNKLVINPPSSPYHPYYPLRTAEGDPYPYYQPQYPGSPFIPSVPLTTPVNPFTTTVNPLQPPHTVTTYGGQSGAGGTAGISLALADLPK